MKGLLIATQVIGAVTMVPYPFVLLANVMSIAAEGQTLVGALPYILLSIYPAVWIGLYALAWRAMGSGSTGVAFALSGVPVLAGLCAIGWYVRSEQGVAAHYSKEVEETRAQIEPKNPLLWKILCAGGPIRLYGAPKVSAGEAVKAVGANPALVNVPVPPFGTPLRTAVMNVATNVNGSFGNESREAVERQRDMMRIVRALVERGAQFDDQEKSDLWRTWQLRRIMLDGAVTTESENPLVWRIVTRDRQKDWEFKVAAGEIPLVNKATRLHGSPLYAALLTNGVNIFPALVQAGARLSEEEQRDPAATKALREMRR